MNYPNTSTIIFVVFFFFFIGSNLQQATRTRITRRTTTTIRCQRRGTFGTPYTGPSYESNKLYVMIRMNLIIPVSRELECRETSGERNITSYRRNGSRYTDSVWTAQQCAKYIPAHTETQRLWTRATDLVDNGMHTQHRAYIYTWPYGKQQNKHTSRRQRAVQTMGAKQKKKREKILHHRWHAATKRTHSIHAAAIAWLSVL